MDNPALSSVRQEDFADFIGEVAGGIASGTRMPLLVYRSLRGRRPRGTGPRRTHSRSDAALPAQYSRHRRRSRRSSPTCRTPEDGFAGTALGAFGSAQGGIPSTVIAPSLLLDEVEIRGFHGEPRRLPLVPPPPMQ